jgi:hypothetical protein
VLRSSSAGGIATGTIAVDVSSGIVTVRVSVVEPVFEGVFGLVFEVPEDGVVVTVAVSPSDGCDGVTTVAARSVAPDPVSHMRPVESVAIPSEIVIATTPLFLIVKIPPE